MSRSGIGADLHKMDTRILCRYTLTIIYIALCAHFRGAAAAGAAGWRRLYSGVYEYVIV